MDPSQVLKGVLDLAVLATVAESDTYGYEVVRRLHRAGLDGVGDASVYGTLRRLYAAGALAAYVVASEQGPHRKYYRITDAGQVALQEWGKTWSTFRDTVDGVLAAAEGAPR